MIRRTHRKFIKFKILLDENFSPRNKLPSLNSRFNVKHASKDLKLSGMSDPDIYEESANQNRIIITFNFRHFRELASKSKNTGVIGVSNNLELEQIDKKLTALLMKSTKGDLFGKFTYISGETK